MSQASPPDPAATDRPAIAPLDGSQRSDRFRRQLRQDTQQWRNTGVITPDQYDYLANAYRFDDLEQAARNRFITILMGLGGILIGLGVITFVAANWQAWGRSFKVMLLLASLMGTNVLGFYGWHFGRDRPRFAGQQRVGQGLLLLGALLLGANLGLMSQLFHQSGPVAALYWIWGGGVVLMAIALELGSLAGMALILSMIGYGSFWGDWMARSVDWLYLVMLHTPLLTVVVFVPLAVRVRSRLLFGAAWGFALLTFAVSLGAAAWGPGMAESVALLLPLALLWGYRDRTLARWLSYWPGRPPAAPEATQAPPQFEPIARGIMLLGLAIAVYLLSFRFAWPPNTTDTWASTVPDLRFAWDVAGWTAIASLFWLDRWRDRQAAGVDPTGWALFGLSATTALARSWHERTGALEMGGPFLLNALLFLLAAGLLRDGLAQGSRLGFWGGMGLLVLQIWTRMFEYDTGLLVKAIAFMLCGLGAIAAGIWFERSVRSFAPPGASSTLGTPGT